MEHNFLLFEGWRFSLAMVFIFALQTYNQGSSLVRMVAYFDVGPSSTVTLQRIHEIKRPKRNKLTFVSKDLSSFERAQSENAQEKRKTS